MARATLVGSQRFTAKLDDLSKEARTRISRVVENAAHTVAADAAISITAGSIQGPGHIRSKPGEPPNAEWGLLHTSFLVRKVHDLRFDVEVHAPYASHLEFGTSRMAARPFLAPAERKNRDEITLQFFDAIRKARGL